TTCASRASEIVIGCPWVRLCGGHCRASGPGQAMACLVLIAVWQREESVVPGLVPGILLSANAEPGVKWIPATSAGMTSGWSKNLRRGGGSGPAAFKELFHAGEEASAFRARILVAFAFELLEQLALALGQVLRRLNPDLNIHVAVGLRAEHGHAFALETELLPALRPFRDLHTCDAAIDRRHLDLAA